VTDRFQTRRRPQTVGPVPGAGGWLGLDDDWLLHRIESLAVDHRHDEDLLDVVRSSRHFFVRQEAAKRIHDREQLKVFSGDRHIAQVLVRRMTRAADAGYLETILRESRHLEVRKAASAQLRLLREERAREGLPGSVSADWRPR
jgi:hypothetical protein